ncbi:MAG: Ldh family oxidoreductase, partial [Planctomycetaceae bacterium]
TGMLGWYTMRAARQGLIGIAMNNGPAITPPYGGRKKVVATNPISIAAPSGESTPVVLDMATTMVAAGKLRLAMKQDLPVPETWGLDRHGQATTDPGEVIQQGFFQWAGAYKGWGLATMIEILSGVLSGGLFGSDVPTMIDYGKDPLISNGFYVAVDVERFLPLKEFQDRVDRLLEQSRRTPPFDPEQPVLVAGDKEIACRRRRLDEGIPLSRQVAEELDGLAESFQVSQDLRILSGR